MGTYALYFFEVILIFSYVQLFFLTKEGSEKWKFPEQAFCTLIFPELILDEYVTKKLVNLEKGELFYSFGYEIFSCPFYSSLKWKEDNYRNLGFRSKWTFCLLCILCECLLGDGQHHRITSSFQNFIQNIRSLIAIFKLQCKNSKESIIFKKGIKIFTLTGQFLFSVVLDNSLKKKNVW